MIFLLLNLRLVYRFGWVKRFVVYKLGKIFFSFIKTGDINYIFSNWEIQNILQEIKKNKNISAH